MANVCIDTTGFDCDHCGRPLAKDFFGKWGKELRTGKKQPASMDICCCGKVMCRRCIKKYSKQRCPHIDNRRAELIAGSIAGFIRQPKGKVAQSRFQKKLQAQIRETITSRAHFGIWLPIQGFY